MTTPLIAFLLLSLFAFSGWWIYSHIKYMYRMRNAYGEELPIDKNTRIFSTVGFTLLYFGLLWYTLKCILV